MGGPVPINRRYISYEMQAMYVGPSGAMNTPGNPSGVVKLDFIQSYGFAFDVDRAPLKQIGSEFYATRQTELAPNVNLNINYYLDQGWNEKFIGMDVGTSASGYNNPFSGIFTTNQDRNFYILIDEDAGSDINAGSTDSFLRNDVLSIGNTYLTNFDLNISVNSLATVDLTFVGANAIIEPLLFNYFSGGAYYQQITNPAVYQTGSGSSVEVPQQMNTLAKQSRYMTGYKELFNGGCPYGGCSVTANRMSTDALDFGFIFQNFQSLSISIPFERKSLYGFGNNHPFDRKILKPVIGTLNLDSIVSNFNSENLQQTFNREDTNQLISGYNFDIVFSNYTGLRKFGIKIQNAKLDSYSINSQIGNQSIISTSWSFEVNERTGILMSGSYAPPVPVANYVTEAINL